MIFFVVRLVDAVVFDLAVRRRRRVPAPQLLRQIVALILYFVLFSSAFTSILDISITAWLTTGTILAAILGLALQDTLGNLFSGIALHMEGGFDVGDVLHSGDFVGVVEQVSWRATRIRAFDNQLIILPNSVIARERLEVFPRNNLNARVLKIGLDTHVPPATVISVLSEAAAHIDGVVREVPVVARVGGFTESAVVYEVKYYTRDYSLRDRIDAEIRKAVWYSLRRNSISFATMITAYQQYTPPTVPAHDLKPGEILGLLREVPLLSPLSEEAHQQLAEAAHVHFYSKGEAILRRGAAGESMFVIASGSVSVRIGDDSEEGWHEVARLGAHTVFGEMALLTGQARTADVVATTDVVAIEIGKELLQPILRSHPDLATSLSAKVMQRQDHLASLQAEDEEEEEQTVVARIRTWFGL